MLKRILCVICLMAVTTGVAWGGSFETYQFSQEKVDSAKSVTEVKRLSPKKDQLELKRELQMIAQEEAPGKHLWERKKSPRVAMFCSMAVPGLGQLYNGRRIKTMLMVGLSGFYMSQIWLKHKQANRREKIRDQFIEIRDQFPKFSPEWLVQNRQVGFHQSYVDFYKEQTKDFAWWSGAVWLIGVLDAYVDAHLHDVRSYRPTTKSSSGTSYLTVTISF
ncbi:MAG: hypothetical protein GTO51_01920 [Candidatus Latescibacteria bacterium]|nr:hypothetical protein [Candidatus Latescibacterota bacterium]NIM22181.1 hypothetical protein [Candidatus Latescibacterota bacterium]NIM64731.1 hypothetical protein [Candidatus Latescibacterota bacterium]NIO01241.1 hypothetical protein [Candidatus Latescibacterota bacterium]NIO27626.1 hypothetical protein [Candidatus Latescibacterota bacterium]